MDANFEKLLDERHNAILISLEQLHETQKDTRELLRAQNGRIATSEVRIAVLEERNPSRSGGIWGAVGGALAGFAAGWMK